MRVFKENSLIFKTLLGGFAIAAAHLFFVLILAVEPSLNGKLLSLTFWDGGWFITIVEEGYRPYAFASETDRTQVNAAFFPGYPLFARGIGAVFGLGSEIALVATSFLAATGVWAILVWTMRDWSAARRTLSLALVFAFPTSFYLVAAYSEGLFLFCLLAWARPFVESTGSKWTSAISGMAMGLTRIVAIPMALVPPLYTVVARALGYRRPTANRHAWWIAAIGTLVGTGLYLGFCKLIYDDFLFPFEATRRGWWARGNFAALWSKALWAPQLSWQWFAFEYRSFDIPEFNRFITTITFWWLLAVTTWGLFRTFRKDPPPEKALFFLVCAWALFAFSAVANFDSGFFSMPRYVFPVAVCLIVAVGEMGHARFKNASRRSRRYAVIGIQILAIIASLLVQAVLIQRFTAREWVAFLCT